MKIIMKTIAIIKAVLIIKLMAPRRHQNFLLTRKRNHKCLVNPLFHNVEKWPDIL